MKWRPPDDDPVNGDCLDCGFPKKAHLWHCMSCGKVSTELTTCGCGACELPVPNCSCRAGHSKLCPTGKRKVTDKEYDDIQRLIATIKMVSKSRPEKKAFADEMLEKMKWEINEINRLRPLALN